MGHRHWAARLALVLRALVAAAAAADDATEAETRAAQQALTQAELTLALRLESLHRQHRTRPPP